MAEKPGTGNIKTIVDKVRFWKGKKIHILAVENQNYVDYQMVLRNMLSESNGYHKQWRQKRYTHEEACDLKDGDEYLSGMKKEEKFEPIITLVVYFGGEHPWDGARCLHDLLDIDEEFKKYVTNYRLNLYDCQEHDTFEEYRTGLRQVFESLRYSKDNEKLKEIMEENKEVYSSIDRETRDILEVVANIKIPEKFKTVEEGRERYDMCKAFEDMRQEGYEDGISKGIEQGIRILIQTCQELGLTADSIMEKCAEKYEMSREIAGKYVKEYCICK
ncbi:MAG: Rpn family recombination-promoting nuclease/putative transposase [Lachnospiraceae bacterium]|nr:Rpn family recombination-promoting nuclease/putative transposase [Lachnospiraceae bacterium]